MRRIGILLRPQGADGGKMDKFFQTGQAELPIERGAVRRIHPVAHRNECTAVRDQKSPSHSPDMEQVA
jgi:hypothetical protein